MIENGSYIKVDPFVRAEQAKRMILEVGRERERERGKGLILRFVGFGRDSQCQSEAQSL